MFVDKPKCLHFQTVENVKDLKKYFKQEKLILYKKLNNYFIKSIISTKIILA